MLRAILEHPTALHYVTILVQFFLEVVGASVFVQLGVAQQVLQQLLGLVRKLWTGQQELQGISPCAQHWTSISQQTLTREALHELISHFLGQLAQRDAARQH